MGYFIIGADVGDRTRDLQFTILPLYQLSYIGVCNVKKKSEKVKR